jgi:membrane protein implicated in regulation of membrane protease activity
MDYSMAVIWLIIAVSCGLIEAGTIALVSVWFVIGAVVSFFMALIFPESILLQIFVFILFSILSLVFIRPVAKKYVDKYTRGGNINSKVDKTGVVVQEIKKDEKGRVKIGDVEWLAVSNEDISEGTKVRITNVYGNTLCVEKVEEV